MRTGTATATEVAVVSTDPASLSAVSHSAKIAAILINLRNLVICAIGRDQGRKSEHPDIPDATLPVRVRVSNCQTSGSALSASISLGARKGAHSSSPSGRDGPAGGGVNGSIGGGASGVQRGASGVLMWHGGHSGRSGINGRVAEWLEVIGNGSSHLGVWVLSSSDMDNV